MELVLFSIVLGTGLAMDAFSVSLANGLQEPDMQKNRSRLIAGTFAFFQIIMPLIGWGCVHTIVNLLTSFQKVIPWIALILLGWIGGKMLIEGIRSFKGDGEEAGASPVTLSGLMLQGVATSIDALSVGFTISDYDLPKALICSLIVGIVTYIICRIGLLLGRKIGTSLSGKSSILGGVILIAIGIGIFVRGI